MIIFKVFVPIIDYQLRQISYNKYHVVYLPVTQNLVTLINEQTKNELFENYNS